MKIALVFPGQGSQVVGMGKDFFENFKESKLVFEEASDAIHVDLKKLCFEGPLEELTLTQNLQPALFTTETAMFRAIQVHTDLNVACVAGHSLGEYSALAATGSLSVTDGAKLTRTRGEAMQKAVPVGTGSMAAILGMNAEQITEICGEAQRASQEIAEPANFNANGQVVISGSVKGVEAACALAKEKGAKVIPLQVSAPFHCSLMKPAQDVMKPLLQATAFRNPLWPVIANVTAELTHDASAFASLLTEQIVKSVMWEQSMTKLRGLGVEKLVEIGPGKVLAGLLKRIDKEISAFNISSVEQLKTY